MTATYTFDIFSSLDGFANHSGDWGGYWGKQGPSSSPTAPPPTATRCAWCSGPRPTPRTRPS